MINSFERSTATSPLSPPRLDRKPLKTPYLIGGLVTLCAVVGVVVSSVLVNVNQDIRNQAYDDPYEGPCDTRKGDTEQCIVGMKYRCSGNAPRGVWQRTTESCSDQNSKSVSCESAGQVVTQDTLTCVR